MYAIRSYYEIRMTAGGEVMVNLVMGKDDRAKRDKILEHLLNRIPGISTLVYMINTRITSYNVCYTKLLRFFKRRSDLRPL